MVISKFESLVLGSVVLLSQIDLAAAADEFSWTDDFTTCNLYRLVDKSCPDDDKKDGKLYTMIPATQRTNNVPGFAVDMTPWGTKSQLWIKMEAYTPVLETGSVFEMYTQIKDHFDTENVTYDSVMCSTEFQGSSPADTA